MYSFFVKKVWFWIVLAAIKCSTYRAKRPSYVAIAHHLFPSFCARLQLTRTFIKNLFRKFFHHGRISSVGGALDRLQNSLFFCVFKYAWAVKQNVWNEAENSLSPDTPVGRSRLASFARERVLPNLPISLLILRKKRLFCSLRAWPQTGKFWIRFPRPILRVLK